MKKRNTDHKKRVRLALTGGVLVVVLMVILVVRVFVGNGLWAKYLYEEEQESLYIAENFYFESDYLVEPTGGVDGHYKVKEGVDEISVTLCNYADELRNSEVDIDYTVTLNRTEGVAKTEKGTLVKNQKSEAVITFSDLSAGTYTVTASSTPYGKTLQATFEVRDAVSELHYSVNDSKGSPFLEVVVTNMDYEGDVFISLPAGVRPDNTDPLMEAAKENSCTVKMESYSSYTFLFFKDDPSQVYSASDITLSK